MIIPSLRRRKVKAKGMLLQLFLKHHQLHQLLLTQPKSNHQNRSRIAMPSPKKRNRLPQLHHRQQIQQQQQQQRQQQELQQLKINQQHQRRNPINNRRKQQRKAMLMLIVINVVILKMPMITTMTHGITKMKVLKLIFQQVTQMIKKYSLETSPLKSLKTK